MKNPIVKKLLHLPATHSETFHERTKNSRLSADRPVEAWPEEWKRIRIKAYPRVPETKLPSPGLRNAVPLRKAFFARESGRQASDKPLTLKDISTLLYFGNGMRDATGKRFYPSAGARYPLETYIMILKGPMESGTYHYFPPGHCLEKLVLPPTDPSSLFNQRWTNEMPAFIIVTGTMSRTTMKYGDRGYRYILMEAGHLGQNISLAAAALGRSCCAIGGFHDDAVNAMLGIDGVRETVLVVFAIG